MFVTEESALVEFKDGAVMFARDPFLPTLHLTKSITSKLWKPVINNEWNVKRILFNKIMTKRHAIF